MLVRASAGKESSDNSPQSTRTRQQPGAACDECRRRKLRCDRQKPQCGACQTSGVACIVPVTKPARGPKRGYLKTLQARISALEGALTSGQQCNPPSAGDVPDVSLDMGDMPDFTDLGDMSETSLSHLAWPLGITGEGDSLPSTRHISYEEKDILSTLEAQDGWPELIQDAIRPGATQRPATHMACHDSTTRTNSSPQTPANTDESSSPGCSPDLTIPSPVQSDLDQLYVDRIHTFIPIIHHGRCAEWAKSDPGSIGEAQTSLRHAMWTLAASASAYHLTLRESLYQRTRQALENLDQRTGIAGDHSTCTNAAPAAYADTEVVQAWLLLSVHELMCVNFRRAWMTAGRAFRLIQLDPSWTTADGGIPSDVYVNSQHNQSQWTEIEQRRRTFWFAYCLDRLMSLRNGSTPTFSERVSVRLPCPEPAFQYGQPVHMGFLEPKPTNIPSASNPSTMVTSSPFHECIVAATVAGHVLSHRRQALMDTASVEETTNTQNMFTFWDRHAWLDSLVADSMANFAAHHPPAAQERDPMLLFLAMVWRATALYLWHTAEGVSVPGTDPEMTGIVGIESSTAQMARSAAQEVLRLMGKMSELNGWKVHPLMSLPLTLCAELLAPRPDLMAAFSQKLREIMQASHSVGPLSGVGMRTYQ